MRSTGQTIRMISKNIEISKGPILIKKQTPASEYGLNLNAFDPSKSSPPNEFMLKLHTRMNFYNDYPDKKVDILINE